MGMSSMNCVGCQHPMISIHSINHINGWMQHVTVLTPSLMVKGVYDGYMRVDTDEGGEYELPLDGNIACYHTACHRVLGEPAFDVINTSDWASDQGHFFGSEHDVEAPENIDELEGISLDPGWVAAWRKSAGGLKAAAECSRGQVSETP